MIEPKMSTDDQSKRSKDRYIQAKTFYDNGVISQEQFLEMTKGLENPENESEATILKGIKQTLHTMDQRLNRLETMIARITEMISTKT